MERAPQGININCILPGDIDTRPGDPTKDPIGVVRNAAANRPLRAGPAIAGRADRPLRKPGPR